MKIDEIVPNHTVVRDGQRRGIAIGFEWKTSRWSGRSARLVRVKWDDGVVGSMPPRDLELVLGGKTEIALSAGQANAGTCPICGPVFVVRARGKGKPKLVKHGYKRPGWGFLIGECTGTGCDPYEVSTEALDKYRPRLVNFIEGERRYMGKLAGDEVEYLTHTWREWVGYGHKEAEGRKSGYALRSEKVMLGAAQVEHGERYRNSYRRTPSYDELRNQAWELARRNIEGATADLARVDQMIRDWKPQPLKHK